jgi:hypothetical protein
MIPSRGYSGAREKILKFMERTMKLRILSVSILAIFGEAIESLRRAKEHLEHAAHDFGGHRVEAIKAIDESLHQLQDCLKYDK